MTFYPWEPVVRPRDYAPFRRTTWEDVDQALSKALRLEGLGIPSVRVGLVWILEYLGYQRDSHHILVPRYLGRCILNAINRHAMPVPTPTERTRMILLAHEFGFEPDVDKIRESCERENWTVVEDAPAGLQKGASVARGALAKLVGLSKTLPVLQGAVLLTEELGLEQFVRKKRATRSAWSWLVAGLLVSQRAQKRVRTYSPWSDFAYEAYPLAGGANAFLRGNIVRALDRADDQARLANARLRRAREALQSRLMAPTNMDVPYVGLLAPENGGGNEVEAFARNGFNPQSYHVDLNRNPLQPNHQPRRVVPFNPRIPVAAFDSLLQDLRGN